MANIQIRYVLCEETPISNFRVNTAKNIRLRLRASFFPEDELSNWRIDFTFVNNLETAQFAHLARERTKMFPLNTEISMDNYIEFILSLSDPTNPHYSWELEL